MRGFWLTALLVLASARAGADCLPAGRSAFAAGLEALHRGDLPAAAKLFYQLVQEQPTCAEARNNLAVVFMEQGRGEEAATQLRQALQVKPDYPRARLNLHRVEALLAAPPAQNRPAAEPARAALFETSQPHGSDVGGVPESGSAHPQADRSAATPPAPSHPAAASMDGSATEASMTEPPSTGASTAGPSATPASLAEASATEPSVTEGKPAEVAGLGRDTPYGLTSGNTSTDSHGLAPKVSDAKSPGATAADPKTTAAKPAGQAASSVSAVPEAHTPEPRTTTACVIEPALNRVCIHQRAPGGVATDECFQIAVAQVRSWPRWLVASEVTPKRIRLLDETGQTRLEIASEDAPVSGDALRLRQADFEALAAKVIPWRTGWLILE